MPSAGINIKGPNINIPGININKPNLNISGNIPNIDTSINRPNIDINGKIPSINANINKPNIDISGKIPGIDIDINGPEFNKSLTLKEICGRDVDENINLNKFKMKLIGVPSEKISGIINPSLNIDLNEPNINIPNLRGKKPNLNINGNIPGFNASFNKPDINIGGNIPGLDINLNKRDLEFDPSITLKKICNENN